MRKTALAMPGLFLAGMVAMSGACAQQGGRITFQGMITSPTCTVSTADQDKRVPMGAVSADEFNRLGDTRGRQRFSLRLEGCPSPAKDQPQRATVRFSGMDINAQTHHLHLMGRGQAGAASGVELRILNAAGEKVLLADSPTGQGATWVALNGSRSQLDFSAEYVAVALPVTSGNADAAVNFEISYP